MKVLSMNIAALLALLFRGRSSNALSLDFAQREVAADSAQVTIVPGTPIYFKFQSGWYKGTVTAMYNATHCTTTWSDGDVEYFPHEQVATMVQSYKYYFGNTPVTADYAPYVTGTAIYYQFEDGWYSGIIVSYSAANLEYKTSWSDGDIEYFSDMGEVDKMVAAATQLDVQAKSSSKKKKLGGGAKFGIVALVFGLLSVLGCFAWKRKYCGKRQQFAEKDITDLHVSDTTTSSDASGEMA
jgi:hypothetical protein